MNILLTGARGQLGHELQRTLAPLGTVIALDRVACDLSKPEQIRAQVRALQPQIIVNAAAYTAVDRAEREPEHAFAINAHAVEVLAQEALHHEALLVHYSTDYVFDGRKRTPYTEADAPHPLSVYGQSKWAGEQAIAASGARALILRSSWVMGVHGHNFIKTVLRLAAQRDTLDVVNDQHGVPTAAAWIAEVTAQLLSRNLLPTGVYHLAAVGMTNWFDYARYVLRAAQGAGLNLRLTEAGVRAVSTDEYRALQSTPLAPRPAYSLLDTRKLQQTFGITPPDWQRGVDAVLEQLFLQATSFPSPSLPLPWGEGS